MKSELLIPPVAEADPDSVEVVRVWVARGGQHVSLNIGAWQDPEAWGIVLADLAGHLANAYEQDLGLDHEETLRKITDLLVAELKHPTDSPRGSVRNRKAKPSGPM
jgi:hypothetical protein